MNRNTLKNVIIGLLIVIIILLVLLYIYHSRNSSPSASTTNAISTSGASSYPSIVQNVQPVILESPYLYDSGYWVSPDSWWMGSDTGNYYVRNNYKTNNYYYDKQSNGNKPVPTTTNVLPTTNTTLGMPLPNPTPSATMSIQNILPTGQLIAPNQDTVFPLPTLAAPSMIPFNSTMMNSIQPPTNITQPQISNSDPTMIADSMSAKIDIQASQMMGMRGGNNLESAVPEVIPTITQLH